ncbi:MAG: methyltransferase [Myxococcota bacterium]|nr:methyltransferase [Myxococcota bacterium]
MFRYRGQLALIWILCILLWAKPTFVSFLVGICVVLFAEGLRFWSVRHIGSASRRRDDEKRMLCRQGPYLWVRNPIYIANVIMWIGLTITSNRLSLLWIPILIGLMYHIIVGWEEWNWSQRMDYERYRNQVPRWIPNVVWAIPSSDGLPKISWMRVLRSERSTLIAIVSMYVFLTFRLLHVN